MKHTRDPGDSASDAFFHDVVTCARYREEIPLVVGGDLEPARMDPLVAHLAGCEPCAAATAEAATARDALLGGLEAGAHEWREPDLWPRLGATLGAPAGSGPGATRVHSFAERALALGQRAALPLAAAAAVLLVLRPWHGRGIPDGGRAGGSADLVPVEATPVAGGRPSGDARLSRADQVFDDYGSGLIRLEAGEEPIHTLPRGFSIPLNQRDIEVLRGEALLRAEPDGNRIRIVRGADETLASFESHSTR